MLPKLLVLTFNYQLHPHQHFDENVVYNEILPLPIKAMFEQELSQLLRVIVYKCIVGVVGRSQAAVCSHKGLLYAFGGTDSWNCYNTVEVYDRQMNVWRFVASMSQARRGAAAVNYRG